MTDLLNFCFHRFTKRKIICSRISDVTLQIAGHVNMSSNTPLPEETRKIAYTVEVCDCPEGYEGLSCQVCTSTHY